MLAFLPGPEEGLPMGCALQGSVRSTKDLSELPSHPGKPLKGGTPHSLSGRFKFHNQRCPSQRTR